MVRSPRSFNNCTQPKWNEWLQSAQSPGQRHSLIRRDFANFAIARRLPKEALHPRIADTVWQAFMRGEYDVAAFQTMKAVEVSVREASGLGADLLGVKPCAQRLPRKAGP